MIFARGHFGTTPFSRVQFTDASTLSKFYELLRNPDAKRYFLLHAAPYDTDTAGTVNRYFGAGLSRISGHTALWKPRLIDAFNVQTDLFGGPLEIGGDGRPAFGAINIGVGDGDLDELMDFLWDGRVLRLYMGGDPADGWTWSEYVEIFNGVAEEATWNEDLFTLVVRDPSTRLDVPLQTTLYDGTGMNEPEELNGKPKPTAYGRPRNIRPILIDRTYLIYQVHYRAIAAVEAVYGKGDGYTADGDVANIDALRAATVSSQTYKTCLNSGLFRIGSTPNGIVTADIQGDYVSSVLNEKRGALLKRILKSRAGLTDAELDLAALANLDSDAQTFSLYVTNPTTVAAVCDALLLPRGFRTFDSTGRFTAGRLEIGVATLELEPPRIASISRERTPKPAYRISLGYARNWTPMTNTDLAVIGTELENDFAVNEFRRVTASDTTVWDPDASTGKHPRAKDLVIDSALNNISDAQTEVDAMLDLLKADRHIYRVTASRIQFRLRAGQTVRLTHSRFGLSGGREMIVLGISENTSTGLTDLRLWG